MHASKRRLSLGALLCWCCAAALLPLSYITVPLEFEVLTLPPWILALLLAGLGRDLQRNCTVQLMAARSSDARRTVLEPLRAGRRVEPFFLYLRPFYADSIVVHNPRKSM